MAMLRWEPFREMENAWRRFWPPYLPDNGPGAPAANLDDSAARNWVPPANISETENEYLIRLELADVKKEDVKIAVVDGIITISGERKLTRGEENENVLRIESVYGTFSRSFVLPESVDDKNIRAEAKDGMLNIHIPKIKTQKPEPISIEVH